MENEFAAPAVTVEGLDLLCLEMKELEQKIDERDKITSELSKELNSKKFRAAQYLNELGRQDYISPHGKIELKKEWKVRMPADDQEKDKLFDHLKERGIFERYATVNSNSLNALYRADWAAAKDRGEGMEFSMPGVPPPVEDVVPKFKASKDKKNVD